MFHSKFKALSKIIFYIIKSYVDLITMVTKEVSECVLCIKLPELSETKMKIIAHLVTMAPGTIVYGIEGCTMQVHCIGDCVDSLNNFVDLCLILVNHSKSKLISSSSDSNSESARESSSP